MYLLTVAFAALLLSYLVYCLLIPYALVTGLVDRPDARKQHNGEIPLVGGMGVFFSVLCVGFWVFPFTPVTLSIALSSLLMVQVGMLDDKFDLSVRLRIVVQLLAASVLVYLGGIQINSLGNLFGAGDVTLGWLAGPFTILAIMTAMNAYNMIDGIDGLLGSLSIVTFSGIAMLAAIHAQAAPLLLSVLMLAALLIFLTRNIGTRFSGLRKIFMGDAGSMFIGLLIVCLLALMTVPEHLVRFGELSAAIEFGETASAVRPVAVLWLIAVPVMDMFGIMARRIMKKQSPFKPDRDHLHHIFMRAGFNSIEALGVIILTALMLMVFGLTLEAFSVPEWLSLALYVAVFCLYLYCLRHVWRIVAWVRARRGIA
ncbi:MAG: undecaprenyl-phosphate alpha-N-acetylglucosaminyl 1-phosphate transferase [Pseudomonas profundi]|uniref:undecaprenyl-phosphate alpha-N-acetylglucosaminyl 1-phosphate transferase n=1 Tax=Pseudomonas profundi TaxID=1981513 RepID=UPI003001F8D6